MTVVLLVRHGQASFGATDYDVLSELGERQARIAGSALAARHVTPDVVVHGAMRRQAESARLMAKSAGWSAPVLEDARWDEMNHLEVLGRHPQPFTGDPTTREFQAWFEAATDRWTGGEYDHEYDESFPSFSARVRNALSTVIGELSESGTAVVVTSGGPIARLASDLLAGDLVDGGLLDGSIAVHRRLAPVVVNASVTKLVVGSGGCSLVSFNDHAHLEGEPRLLTYR